MSDRDPVIPPGRSEATEDRPISFVQRLHREFGAAVDPEINLQDPDEGDSDSAKGIVSKAGLLFQKLAEQIGLGPRYKIHKEIARGGMGTILRVWDEDLRRNLAMKVLNTREPISGEGQSTQEDEERLSRFLEEAQITGQLDHPGIVPVHDLGIDQRGRCYFTMRLVRGRELKEILDLARERKESWTTTRALGLVLKVCEAMAFAHSKGVVHRDLKPSNVMVGRFGEVCVMDWGLARVLGRHDSHDLRLRRPEEASSYSLVRTVRKDETESNPDSPLVTMDGDVVGTPSYMAPEQAQGKLEQVGQRSDVYALGSILYYMLTSQVPYVKPGERVSPHTVLNRVLSGPPESVRKLATDEPAELIAICEKAMARDPEQRYGSMLEVADDIQAYLENRVVRAYEGGSLAEFRTWVRRNRGMAAGIAGMVTLSIASALGFALQKQRQIGELGLEQQATQDARERAVIMADEAQRNADAAEKNMDLANKRAEEAKQNELRASENENDARRRGYMANLLAAHFSLKLNDVSEARERLSDCEPLLRDWEWDHLRLASHPDLETFGRSTQGFVDDVAWFPDGSRIAVLRRTGQLRVLDAVSGNPVPGFDFQKPAFSPTELSPTTRLRLDLSSDGTRIAVVGGEPQVRVYDAASGKMLYERPPEGARPGQADVTAAAFSRDGRSLASAEANGSLVLWDEELGEIVHRLSGHTGEVLDLAWSPNSRLIASASRDGTVRLWDAFLGQLVHKLLGHRGEVRAVAWDDTGTRVFSGGDDGVVNQWSADNGRLVSSFSGHEGAVHSLEFDPSTEKLVSASEDRTVRIWDVSSGASNVVRGPEKAVLDAVLSPDGTLVLTGSEDGTSQIYDARGDLASTELRFHAERIETAAFSPNGEKIVSGDSAGELVVWDALSGEPLRRFRARFDEQGEPARRLRAHAGAVTAALFSPDGRFVFSASMDATARRWEVDTGLEKSLYPHPARVTAMMLATDGTELVTGCSDNVLRVFDVESGELVSERENLRAQEIAPHPDGKRFATGGVDVRIWSLDGTEPERVFDRPSFFLGCAFSPDGTLLAGVSSGKEVCLWEVETGREIAADQEHEGSVRGVAFHPDGTRFATGSLDGTVRIRDASSGLSMLTLEWPGARITTVAFSKDGARLLVGSQEGALRIFETGGVEERRRRSLESRELLAQARPLVEELFAEHLFLDEVLLRLQSTPDLSSEIRSAALRLAQLEGDDPARWLEQSLLSAMPSGQGASVYERALELAERARSLAEPLSSDEKPNENPRLLLALGVAEYRLARYTEALGSLSRIGEESLSQTPREEALQLLFLSMAQFQTGEAPNALATFQRAQGEVARSAALAADPSLRAVCGEAEDLITAEKPLE